MSIKSTIRCLRYVQIVAPSRQRIQNIPIPPRNARDRQSVFQRRSLYHHDTVVPPPTLNGSSTPLLEGGESGSNKCPTSKFCTDTVGPHYRQAVLPTSSATSAWCEPPSRGCQITQWFANEDAGKKMQHQILRVTGKRCGSV